MCVCQYIFTSLFRSWLNACHPPSPLLFSVPLVSIRLTRLWTILCPVSMVLAQPALRAARKVMFITLHTVHMCAVCAVCAARAALICTTASCISLSPFAFAALPTLLVRPAAVVLDGEQSRSGRISMHSAEPLGRCVFCILAVPDSPHFHVGNTNIL